MVVGEFAKVWMIELLLHDKACPDLTPKCLETSETSEMNELYNGYLRFSGAIDSV